MKRIALIFLAAVMVLTITACSGKKLIGTWENGYDRLTFEKDGTLFWAEGSNGQYGPIDFYEYKVSGDKLTIIFDEDEVEEYTYKISGRKLTISWGDDDDAMVLMKQ